MTTTGKAFPVLARAFSRSRAKRSSSPATSPPRTTCFDIFSPPPGDSDVISHVDRLSSNETKIAPRSVRIAVSASGRSATVCMVASRVGGSNLTLPKCRSLSTSPWDLEGEPAVGADLRKSCEPRSSSLPLVTTKPGSSPGTATVLQPKCEPINAGLIRTLRPI